MRASGVYAFWPAASAGDDIILYEDDVRREEKARLHNLRQQWLTETRRSYYCNADFIAPADSGRKDYVGGFAVTGGLGTDELVQRCQADNDDYGAIMGKVFADRLAEAFAERLHEIARRDWGFGQGENLTIPEMLAEKYRGVRPAPGYPSLPDHTEKRILFDLLGAERAAGISLTESCMMLPAGLGERLLLRPSRFAVLRHRSDHARPGRGIRPPQGLEAQRGREVAGPRAGV